MAHKKGVGSSKNGRESESKRLGVKLFGGETAKAGNIIIRQRGTEHHPGQNVGIGRDHTIYALIDGTVVFRKGKDNRSYISIQGVDAEPAKVQVQPAVPQPTIETIELVVDETVDIAEPTEVAEEVSGTAEVEETEVVVKKAKPRKTKEPAAEVAVEA